jgi:hypothetical protein
LPVIERIDRSKLATPFHRPIEQLLWKMVMVLFSKVVVVAQGPVGGVWFPSLIAPAPSSEGQANGFKGPAGKRFASISLQVAVAVVVDV